MKKPTPTAIASAVPLTKLHPELRAPDPMARCHLCGVDGATHPLRVWRECDERDQPVSGDGALLFVCTSKPCAAAIEQHPRLYIQDEQGQPGHFPLLCRDCQHRDGLSCRHADLKANGGAGLTVKLEGLRMIICSRGRGCTTPRPSAVECTGFSKRSSVEGATT